MIERTLLRDLDCIVSRLIILLSSAGENQDNIHLAGSFGVFDMVSPLAFHAFCSQVVWWDWCNKLRKTLFFWSFQALLSLSKSLCSCWRFSINSLLQSTGLKHPCIGFCSISSNPIMWGVFYVKLFCIFPILLCLHLLCFIVAKVVLLSSNFNYHWFVEWHVIPAK